MEFEIEARMFRAISAALLFAMPASALEIEFRSYYDLSRPASLEYDPTFCGLWIANEGQEVVLVTLDGLELRRFGSDLSRIKAIAISGDHLLLGDGFGRFQRVSKDGEPLGEPFRILPQLADTEGIAVLEDGTIVMVEDDPAQVIWVSAEGKMIRNLDGHTLDPMMTEPQGIAIAPDSGNLLIVDDWEGTNSLFELSPEGALIEVTSLIEFGTDPEGIALRPATSSLFVAFDQGAGIAAFDVPEMEKDQTDTGSDCMMF